jgi:hypothetical protein
MATDGWTFPLASTNSSSWIPALWFEGYVLLLICNRRYWIQPLALAMNNKLRKKIFIFIVD